MILESTDPTLQTDLDPTNLDQRMILDSTVLSGLD